MLPPSGATQPSCTARKRRAARLASRTPLSGVARWRDRARPLLRIFNYHSIPPSHELAFERQIDHLLGRFGPADPAELDAILREGPGSSPLALFTFDDGLRNHLAAAAVLERRGVRGIFCVPAAFPAVAGESQADWFERHVYPTPTELHGASERRSMTWVQIRELAGRGHRICSHGTDHVRISSGTPTQVVEREIVASRVSLEKHLPGVQVDGFCWPGAWDRSARRADRLIRETYSYSLGNDVRPLRAGVSPYNLPRINIEASWPLEVVDLQLSGLLDAVYAARRLRP